MDETLFWNPDFQHNNSNGNITFRDGNTVAVFNSNSSHRTVYSNVGFSRGDVAQWKVTIIKSPCCGYCGIAKDGRWGTYDTFADSKTCVGFSNFSGERNVGRNVGDYCIIRLDMAA